jgi:hypothetical protein
MLIIYAYLKALGCLNPGGQRGFPLSSTAQHTLTLSSPDVSRIPASGREGCGSPPGVNKITILNHIMFYLSINELRKEIKSNNGLSS